MDKPKKRKSFMDRIGIASYRCGICLSEDKPCNNCIKSTLKANGLPLTFKKELKELSDTDNAHAFGEYSPFRMKLNTLIKQSQKG